MPEAVERPAFEMFPHRPLPVGFHRRQLWAALKIGMEVYSGMGQGGQAYRLTDLGLWADEQLAPLLPAIVPGTRITTRAGYVCAQASRASAPLQLFAMEDVPALLTFNQFNGLTPLSAVSRRLAQTMGWDEAHSFAYVRGLFLCLVVAGLGQPASLAVLPEG
jgi:hypothetical protein